MNYFMANQRLPTEPMIQVSTRRGSPSQQPISQRRSTLMENTQEELKAHLMQTDEGFRRLADQHMQYHQQLEALEAKAYLTPQEEVEEHRLKKLKLHLKDQMNQIMSRYRAQHVA
jgi:uncharacterized protein YdcH (DUF465 family)